MMRFGLCLTAVASAAALVSDVVDINGHALPGDQQLDRAMAAEAFQQEVRLFERLPFNETERLEAQGLPYTSEISRVLTGPTSVVFTGIFQPNQAPNSNGICSNFNSFRSSLSGQTCSSVTVYGTNDPVGRTCSGPQADKVCNALASYDGSTATYTACSDTSGVLRLWSVGPCGTGGWISLSGSTTGDLTCKCELVANKPYTVYPCTTDKFGWAYMLNGATTPSSDDPNSADSCPSPSPASQTVSVRAMIGDAPAPTPYPTCAVLPATAVGSSLTLWLQPEYLADLYATALNGFYTFAWPNAVAPGPLDATQADIEQLPLPGYSGSPFPGLIVALFSGEAAQSNLVSPLDLSGTPYTIVFVGGLGEVPTDPMARLLSAVNTGPSDDWYMGSLGGQQGVAGCGGVQIGTPSAVVPNVLSVWSLTSDADGNVALYQNSQLLGTGSWSGCAPHYLRLGGGYYDPGTDSLTGFTVSHMVEVIVYTSALSATDLATLEMSLAVKYQLTAVVGPNNAVYASCFPSPTPSPSGTPSLSGTAAASASNTASQSGSASGTATTTPSTSATEVAVDVLPYSGVVTVPIGTCTLVGTPWPMTQAILNAVPSGPYTGLPVITGLGRDPACDVRIIIAYYDPLAAGPQPKVGHFRLVQLDPITQLPLSVLAPDMAEALSCEMDFTSGYSAMFSLGTGGGVQEQVLMQLQYLAPDGVTWQGSDALTFYVPNLLSCSS